MVVHGHRAKQKISPTYGSWRAMMNRCHNPNHDMYYAYGERGITVADEWRGRGGFERFLEHVGKRPSRKHTLDRIDPSKGYEPGNVRWKTKNFVDGRSHHTRTAIGPDGLEHELSLGAWADMLGLEYRSLCRRLQRAESKGPEAVAAVFAKKAARRG
jgi:hypothetical protein